MFIELYSDYIYPFISSLLRYSFGWLPFSIGDIFYTLVIIYIIRWCIVSIKTLKYDPFKWLLQVFKALIIGFIGFKLFWGFNYNKPPLHHILNIEANYTTEELISFTKRLITTSNRLHNQLAANDTVAVVLPFTTSEIFNKAPNGYKALSNSYPQLKYQPQSIKPSLYNTALSYMGFSGYLNPFTNEAQVNALIPIYKQPTTTCHEMAHQLGFAAENEANFIGSLAAVNNTDLYFQYSGYTFMLRYCLKELSIRNPTAFKNTLNTINTGILKNYQASTLFWASYQNPLEPVFKSTFDTFLKVNNQKAGIKSYNYVVALLVNYYKTQSL